MNAPFSPPASGTILASIFANRILSGEYPCDDDLFTEDAWRTAAFAAVRGDPSELVTMLCQVKAHEVWQTAGLIYDHEQGWIGEPAQSFGDWFAARAHHNWQPFADVRWWKQGEAA